MVYSGVGHAPPRNTASLLATGLIVMVEFAHFNRDEEEFPMTEDRLLIEEPVSYTHLTLPTSDLV